MDAVGDSLGGSTAVSPERCCGGLGQPRPTILFERKGHRSIRGFAFINSSIDFAHYNIHASENNYHISHVVTEAHIFQNR